MSIVESNPGGGTTLTREPDLEEMVDREMADEGDHDRFAHYVNKNEIVESAVTGKPVRALCGKKWIPSRDPQKFPVCPVCKEIYQNLPAE